MVVGHRNSTIEGKITLRGDCSVNDLGESMVLEGRTDIRLAGNENRTLIYEDNVYCGP